MSMIFKKVSNTKNAKIIYEINNEKQSRKNSTISKKFSFKSHLKWLEKILKNKNETIFLASLKKEIIGLLRERKKYNKIYLSWALKKKFRGKKLGKSMLKKYVSKNKKKYYAKIKEKNLPSIKVCEYSGFKKIKKINQYFYFIRSF